MAQGADDRESRALIWHKMLEALYRSGLLDRSGQWHIAADRCLVRIKNLPAKAFYGFDPTCYFGVYRADTFFFEDGAA